VLRIRIWTRRIRMSLSLPDLHPDPLVRGTDPDPDSDPDPSVTKAKIRSKKNLDSYGL
jgi:hypothetical protein